MKPARKNNKAAKKKNEAAKRNDEATRMIIMMSQAKKPMK